MNRKLILKFAQRLEKFKLEEMISLSELEESEVISALKNLVDEKLLKLNKYVLIRLKVLLFYQIMIKLFYKRRLKYV